MTTVMTDVPANRPTTLRTVLAMTARDLRVIRRNFVMNTVRIVLQPLLFVFVFAYVLPEIGAAPGGGLSTVMVPGLVASSMIMQAMASIIFPLVMDLSVPGAMGDRVLAPISVRAIGVQKIVTATIEGLVAGVLVFPVVIFVHARGEGPALSVPDWPLLVGIMLIGALFAAAFGMYLGTIIDPRQVQVLFTLVMFPAMMLGCVYFPWSALAGVPWLQWAVLVNPMVYLSEALRAALTPQISHMPVWVTTLVLGAGTVLFTFLALRSFVRRVTA